MRYGGYQEPIPARALCHALREYARLHYGGMSAAVAELRALNISTSEDVGRVVDALVLAGSIQKRPAGSGPEFEGLFTVENLDSVRLL